MTVENLASKTDGKNPLARAQALARRATMDTQDRIRRNTLEKDSFLAFGHNANGSEIEIGNTFQNFKE